MGWIAGEVDRITPTDPNLKIPHMGWNTLNVARPHPLLDGIPLGPQGRARLFRALLSAQAGATRDLVATADYGGPVTAIVARDNIVGTQFHPEKSQKARPRADREFSEVDAMMNSVVIPGRERRPANPESRTAGAERVALEFRAASLRSAPGMTR